MAALHIPSWASIEKKFTIANWSNVVKGNITCSERHKMVSQCKVSRAGQLTSTAEKFKRKITAAFVNESGRESWLLPLVKSTTFKHKWLWLMNSSKKRKKKLIYTLDAPLERKSSLDLPMEVWTLWLPAKWTLSEASNLAFYIPGLQ